MVEVIEVNDIEELSQYRMLWNSLFPGTPNATFFHTFDWLETYWRHFGHDQKLRVLIVFASGAPIGILPLCVRTEPYRLSKVRVLTYPLDNWSTWYGPIGPNPASTLLAAMQHIRRTPRDWDMIELRWVADEATQGGKSVRAMRVAGMFSAKQEYQWTSVVDLPASWDEYLASKSQSLRRQFKRTLRDYFNNGDGQYIRHRPAPASQGDGDPRWDLYAMCESVAQSSWQSHVINGNTLTHERVREYFHAAHAAAARLGMVDVNVLAVHGKPAAFLYGYHYNGNVTALRTGFDAANDGGIGSALMLQAIQDSCHRGDRTIDFGPGEREHKRRLRTRTESTYRLTYTPFDSWRSQAVRFTRWAKRRVGQTRLCLKTDI
jgi:CelD/BcsL family acetyltransferase involved in cellulose biosynthesis